MKVVWLHISDWHQKNDGQDRDVLRSAFLKCIENRTRFASELRDVDFICFSGDLTQSGKVEEFDKTHSELLYPLTTSLGLWATRRERVFFVPGNHDLNRSIVTPPTGLIDRFVSTDEEKSKRNFSDCIENANDRVDLPNPFNAYSKFVKKWCSKRALDKYEPAFYSVHVVKKDGKKISIVCLNSALLCARRMADDNKERWDRGFLQVSEWQLRNACREIPSDSNLKICMIHHPINWLTESDQITFEEQIGRNCQIILHGHEHRARISRVHSNIGEYNFIPSGSIFAGHLSVNPRFINCFNFVTVDLNNLEAEIFAFQWRDEEDEWLPDLRFGPDGRQRFFISPSRRDEALRRQLWRHEMEGAYYTQSIAQRTCREMELEISINTVLSHDETFAKVDIKRTMLMEAGKPEDLEYFNNDR